MSILGLLRSIDGSWEARFEQVYTTSADSGGYRGCPGPGVAVGFLSRDPKDPGTGNPELGQLYLPVADADELAIALLLRSDSARYKASGGDPEGGYSDEAANARVLKRLIDRFVRPSD